jgi:glycosyltransferase involved in cell wall biosynthesis
MRVLQIISPSKLAGAELYVTMLSKQMEAHGCKVIVLTKNVPSVVDRMRAEGLDVRADGLGGKINPRAVYRVMRLLKKERIDIINTHLSSASLTGSIAGRLAGVPVVSTVHALNSALCFRFANHLMAVSGAAKKHIAEQGIDANRITVVYPGVDMDAFKPAGKRTEVRESLGIPADAPVVGIVAHLSEKKGHWVLLDAIEGIILKMPGVRFIFAGDGPLRDKLVHSTKVRGISESVMFLGFRDDVRDVIDCADVIVLPSIRGEGLPVSLIQAMAMHKPIVASRLSGIPELVKDGETGIVVTPGDPQELADAIVKLLSNCDLMKQMGDKARTRAELNFSLAESTEHTIDLYCRVLGVSSPGDIDRG